MRHEAPKGFKPSEYAPSKSLLDKASPEHAFGPLQASPDRLQMLATTYEQWVGVYQYAGDKEADAQDAGDKAAEAEYSIAVGQAVRRMGELLREICECNAQDLEGLARKARILRECSKEWWQDGEQPLARSLVMDALRLAEIAPPHIPDFTPSEILAGIDPNAANPVAS